MTSGSKGATSWGSVTELLERAVDGVFPAAQLLVVDGGELVLERAVGRASTATWFDIASLTKPLCTTTLTMLLCDRGQLELETEARPGVTVRHLLSHRSGLPAWQLLTPVASAPDRRAGLVEAVRRAPLDAPPGAVARYSDLGFILLGDLLERVAGRRLDQLFADEIARPLGVATTFLPSDPTRCAPTEVVEGAALQGVVHDENARAMGGVAGHAGLFSTASDVSRLIVPLVEAALGSARKGGLMSSATVREFWAPLPDSTWCLGWDRPSPVHSSAGHFWPRDGVGHLGFTGCSIWIDPPRRRWVVLLSNRVHPSRANEQIRLFRPQLHDAIVAALAPHSDARS